MLFFGIKFGNISWNCCSFCISVVIGSLIWDLLYVIINFKENNHPFLEIRTSVFHKYNVFQENACFRAESFNWCGTAHKCAIKITTVKSRNKFSLVAFRRHFMINRRPVSFDTLCFINASICMTMQNLVQSLHTRKINVTLKLSSLSQLS